MKLSPFSAASTVFLSFFLLQTFSLAQSVDPYAEARDKDSALQNYRALQQGRSATPDADVALSADVIVDLLRKEPALKLQIKRVLIQKALDQGRLLAEEDLGDTELFGLIRDQFTIRKIASEEIEKRHYLPLRPTDEEVFEARLTQRRVEQLEKSESNRQEGRQREADGESGEANRSPVVRTGAPGKSLLVPSITPEPALPSEREVIAGINQPSPSTPRVLPRSVGEDSDRTFRKKPNPYATVPSLYDLYEQSPSQGRSLERFGATVFENGTGNVDQLPMDVPVGPDYVIGPGDGLNVDLWGSVSQRLQRVVDREGRLSLPEVGTVLVAGKTLGEVQQTVQKQLRNQFRDVQTDISLARLRTVRVYVVGDVAKPGAYDVSSLSTALNAVYLAGGPTAKGSLRVVRHQEAFFPQQLCATLRLSACRLIKTARC
ncbi:MAG: hypothetical protein DMG60_16630 [Acidobacteria bacterium]|nr:MAG: hypothetical protein DMG60_16630 [Acidobacteriota bacterium]